MDKEEQKEADVITGLSPALVDNLRCKKVAEYEKLSMKMAELEIARAIKWPDFRKDAKSVKDAEMEWDRTEEGQEIIYLKHKLKSTEKKISALSARMRRFELEARNQY